MTNNIEKMYKLAKIEATTIGCTNEYIQSPDYYSNDCEGDCIDCIGDDENRTYFTNEPYPITITRILQGDLLGEDK